MYITRAAAQEIVEEIGAEIQENINMMDEEGRIIASTDSERIGQIHEGAKQIISEGLDELFISEDMENATTKMGTNLALKIDGEIVGVVGITGERDRIIGYGNIVRHMTEIMIQDSMQKDAKRYDRRMRYRFIEEWIFQTNPPYYANFIERGKKLGIDVNGHYRVMTIQFRDYGTLSESLEGQHQLEEMESTIRHEMERLHYPYLREPTKQICLIPFCDNASLIRLVNHLIEIITQKYNRRIVVGLDSDSTEKMDVRQSYMEADRATSYAILWNLEWFFYDGVNIELLLNEVSDQMLLEYLIKLFPGIHEEEFGSYMSLIEAYFAYEGSITAMAEALYMHKNTLQYKLKKLADVTGKDIRKPSCSAIYHVALISWRRIVRNQMVYRDVEERSCSS